MNKVETDEFVSDIAIIGMSGRFPKAKVLIFFEKKNRF
jgi:acyl transferase domain-containing protein